MCLDWHAAPVEALTFFTTMATFRGRGFSLRRSPISGLRYFLLPVVAAATRQSISWASVLTSRSDSRVFSLFQDGLDGVFPTEQTHRPLSTGRLTVSIEVAGGAGGYPGGDQTGCFEIGRDPGDIAGVGTGAREEQPDLMCRQAQPGTDFQSLQPDRRALCRGQRRTGQAQPAQTDAGIPGGMLRRVE